MWFVIGIILGVALLGLIVWLRSKNMSLTWYEWLIGVIGFLLLVFTVQNVLGSNAEFESTAATKFLLVTGLPAVILLAIAWLLAWRRQRTT